VGDYLQIASGGRGDDFSLGQVWTKLAGFKELAYGLVSDARLYRLLQRSGHCFVNRRIVFRG